MATTQKLEDLYAQLRNLIHKGRHADRHVVRHESSQKIRDIVQKINALGTGQGIDPLTRRLRDIALNIVHHPNADVSPMWNHFNRVQGHINDYLAKTPSTGGDPGAGDPGTGTGGTTNPPNPALLDNLRGMLKTYGFTDAQVESLVQQVIKPAINQGLDQNAILELVRGSDAYKEVFGVNWLRNDKGLPWMNEGDILAFRQNAAQVASSTLGLTTSQADLDKLLVNNKSLDEFQHDLNVEKTVQQLGGAVKDFFQQNLGVNLDAKSLHNFFNPEKDTAYLDQLYQNAIFTQFQHNLGVKQNITPEQLAALKAAGVTTDQAMANYASLAQGLPSLEHLAAIDQNLASDTSHPFNTFGSAFSAYNNLDPGAKAQIANEFAQNIARSSSLGGAASSGLQAVGLLTAEQRRQYGG